MNKLFEAPTFGRGVSLIFFVTEKSFEMAVFLIDIDKRLAYVVSALMLGYGLVHVKLSERDASR
jgi:hypothetical protein